MTESIESEVAGLRESHEAGFALPAHWYTGGRRFERERDVVLRRSWNYAAHTSQLAKAGDQVVTTIAGVPVVLVRDEEAAIRGYVNICRHRAHPVVLESGNRRTLQCLYHGWTYNLDGCLRRAPRAEFELDFDKAMFGLVPVQVAVWGPTVWVNVDRSAPGFDTWIDGLPALVRERGIDVDSFEFAFERSWTINANWKVFLDNANECYHCPTCHSALSSALDMEVENQEFLIGGRYWVSNSIPFRREAWNRLYPSKALAPDEEPPAYHFHWIFPATYFQYKGDEEFDIGSVAIDGVDRIRFTSLVFLPKTATAAERADREARADLDPTIGEDIAICERVQISHEAGFSPQGRLLPQSESLVHHLQGVLLDMLVEQSAER